MDLSLIKTIVVVIMENRSFDHLLGYLSLAEFGSRDVDGVKDDPKWRDTVANPFNGSKFPPFALTDPYHNIDADPPHERSYVASQMGVPVGGVFPMDGFVANYAGAKGAACLTLANPPPVMGYFGPSQAPVTAFFAQKFAICDHWFAALPAGTQPNRLMAMSGFSTIDVNQTPLPHQELVYDWLTARGIRWRVYHETVPFFAMMLNWIPEILAGDNFRPLAQLTQDVQNEPPDVFPQVLFIEPAYTDCPHIEESTDDHAPTAIRGGQKFLLEAYRDMTANPDLWAGTVMIVTYDEHGGFFDHVSPPSIRTDPPPGAHYQVGFASLGVRVPAFVISPFVTPGKVCHALFDHTSILKFIGQKFGENGGYSQVVDERAVGSVADLLTAPGRTPAPTIPSLDAYLAKQGGPAGLTKGATPQTDLQWGFQEALDTIRVQPADQTGSFEKLLNAFPPRVRPAPV
jgi:phospholipase C